MRRHIQVVPAKAGTHTPRPLLLKKEDNDLRAKAISAGGYGSRPSPGRQSSRPAERLHHALFRQRWIGVGGELRLVLEWFRQHRQQLLERRVIVVVDGGL